MLDNLVHGPAVRPSPRMYVRRGRIEPADLAGEIAESGLEDGMHLENPISGVTEGK
jgi:hypothetical protein